MEPLYKQWIFLNHFYLRSTQGAELHSPDSMESDSGWHVPSPIFPPSQKRVRYLWPPSQDFEHVLHEAHSAQCGFNWASVR